MSNKKEIEKDKKIGYEERDKLYFGGNRIAVLERDHYRCKSCGMTNEEHKKIWHRELTIDHIDGSGRNSSIKNNKLSNLQTLCLKCHGIKDGVKIGSNCKPVEIRDLRGNIIKRCKSQEEASRFLGVSNQMISLCYLGHSKVVKGYKIIPVLAQAERELLERVKKGVIGEDEYCDDWCGDIDGETQVDVCTCGAERANELRKEQRQALKLLSLAKTE